MPRKQTGSPLGEKNPTSLAKVPLEGRRNASQLWRELHGRGFNGQPAIVRNWIRKQYGPRSRRTKQRASFSPAMRTSPRQTAWLPLKQLEDALLISTKFAADLRKSLPADLSRGNSAT